MRFVVAFIVAILWCAWLISSALFLDGYRPDDAMTALGCTLMYVNAFGSFGVGALLIGIVSREISL